MPFNKGYIPWNKGKNKIDIPKLALTEERKMKISKANSGKKHNWSNYPILIAEKNPLWKGEDVSYRNLHRWVDRWLGKSNICSICGEIKNRISWANKDHKYKRNLEDWIRMCPKCHSNYDREHGLR